MPSTVITFAFTRAPPECMYYIIILALKTPPHISKKNVIIYTLQETLLLGDLHPAKLCIWQDGSAEQRTGVIVEGFEGGAPG